MPLVSRRGVAALAIIGAGWGCDGSDVTFARGYEPTPEEAESEEEELSDPAAGVASAQDEGSIPAFGAPLEPSGAASPTQDLVLACGSGALTADGGQALDRLPYVQNVTATSAVLLFTTRELGQEPTIRLTKPSGGPPQVVQTDPDPEDASGHQRMARLTELEPDTTYC